MTESHLSDRFGREFRDYYSLLGIPWSASLPEVEAAYRRAVAMNRPDRFSHDPLRHRQAQQLVQTLNEGMTLLRDPAARYEYNRRFRSEMPLRARLEMSARAV